MTPEKVVQNAIIAYLKKLEDEGKPVMYDRRQAGGFSYKMGVADLWASIDGRHVEIEVKRPGGQLRPMQEKWRDRCHMKKVLWLCADSVQDLKDFIADNFPAIF